MQKKNGSPSQRGLHTGRALLEDFVRGLWSQQGKKPENVHFGTFLYKCEQGNKPEKVYLRLFHTNSLCLSHITITNGAIMGTSSKCILAVVIN